MNFFFDILKEPGFWTLAIVLATPLLFGILGAQLCRNAGVVNLGAEGLFIVGAFAGHAAAQWGWPPWPGLAFAAAIGLAPGFVIGALSGARGPAQPFTGIAVTLLAMALAVFAARTVPDAALPSGAPFAPVQIPHLSTLPYVGRVLFAQTPLVYFAIGCALLLAYLVARTPFGLVMRAAGDNPLALAAQGRSVLAVRTVAVMLGSALMAIGGACLTLGAGAAFTPGMVHGRGWLCVAVALAVGPRVSLAVAAALLLGAIDAIDERLIAHLDISATSIAMLPYALAVIALVAIGRRGGTSPATAA